MGNLTGRCSNKRVTGLPPDWLRDGTEPPRERPLCSEPCDLPLNSLSNLECFDYKPAEIKHAFLHEKENTAQRLLGTEFSRRLSRPKYGNWCTGTGNLLQNSFQAHTHTHTCIWANNTRTVNWAAQSCLQGRNKRRRKDFCKYHPIKENNSFADTNYVVVVVLVLSPVCNMNSHEF